MSGIEVVGVVLGAFPLCISALEHYEDTRRAAGTFINIRRQHGKNYRRIRLCQTQFTLTIRQLLQPLLESEAVDQQGHDQLLVQPGGKLWQEPHIRAALSDRLAEGSQDFVDALQDMLGTMAELSDHIYVNDPRFQALLKAKEQGHNKKPGQSGREIDGRAVMTNMAFQTRRLKYAMTEARRDALLDDVDKQNELLRNIVDSNDRLVSLSQDRDRRVRVSRPQKAMLNLWTHAERIFRLLHDSWNCQCRAQHCAELWLKHRSTGLVDFQMHLRYCQGTHGSAWPWTSKSVKISPKENDPPQAIPVPVVVPEPPPLPAGKKKSTRFSLPWRDKKPEKSAPSITVSAPSTPESAAAKIPAPAASPALSVTSLCKAIASGAKRKDDAITVLADQDHDVSYSVDSALEAAPGSVCVSLADLLKTSGTAKLPRVHRFSIALTLASSHLQLHSTPWLHDEWDAENVHLPITVANGKCTSMGAPYLSKHFVTTQTSTSFTSKPDRSFVSLGIVLLELCFGQRFDECSFWSQPGYAALKANPNMRLTVAFDWLEGVEEDAGVDYSSAVEWTLRQAPVAVKDNTWRQDFAENVVQPLARNYELLSGSKARP